MKFHDVLLAGDCGVERPLRCPSAAVRVPLTSVSSGHSFCQLSAHRNLDMRVLTPSAGVLKPVAGLRTQMQCRFRSTTTPATDKLSPRWLADIKSRVGKCVTFGLNQQQVGRAGKVLEVVGRDWRDLVAGSEGFLTEEGRRGLFRHRVQWGEMDCMGHVNNVTYNRYAESARVNWARNFATTIDPAHRKEWSEFWTPRGLGMILRSIRTDYKFPMTWPDHISVYHKLADAPGSKADHFVLDVMILSERHQRPAARCWEDIVVYDYKEAKKAPLKPFMVEEFRKTWELQQEAKERNSEKVRQLLQEVRDLELESWDREDAVEDLGSAAGQ